MCEDCGCQEGNEKKYFAHNNHGHSHPHGHEHGHDHSHHHHHEGEVDTAHDHHYEHEDEHKFVNMERNVLAKNQEFAEKNRKWLTEKGVVAVNLISSPGTGKTTLLETTLENLQDKMKCSVIVGDQSTDNDMQRLKEKCENVYQIETHSSCHLTAEQVSNILPEVVDDDTDILFIENVGNLICPAAFDLGENFKIALVSTTEGEDKPLKYPVIFTDAKVVILTKSDLIPHLDWDLNKFRKALREVNPGVFVFELNAKSAESMNEWLNYLQKL